MKAGYFVMATIILFLAVLPASAELRQWTDEKGVKHFSNQKELPGDVSVERSWEEKESRPDAERSYQNPSPYTRPQSGPGTTKQKKANPGFESKADILIKIRSRKENLKELFERIYTKRRYVKRQGKKDIDRIRRLEGEIEALEKSGTADSGRIKQLKEESDAAKERLFNENLRTRKGVGEDIREYKKIEAEIKALQKRL
jgi:hypothetical protein